MKNKNLTRVVLALSLAFPTLNLATQNASATPCGLDNYVVLADKITIGSATRIESNYSGALVGETDRTELSYLANIESGQVSNEASPAAHVAAMGQLQLLIDSISPMTTTSDLITGELSTDYSPNRALGTFIPGVYKSAGAINVIAGKTITLDAGGNSNGKFYFISEAAFVIGGTVTIFLTGGAQAKNVFFLAGSLIGDGGLGAGSTFNGNFLSRGTLTIGASTHITGSVLAQGTVTLGASTVVSGAPPESSCSAPLAPAFTLSSTSETRTQNTVATGFRVSSTGGAITSFAISSIPPGMSFDTATGSLTGTPSTVASATSYTVTATNGTSPSATQVFTLTVTSSLLAPAFTLSDSSETRTVESAAGFTTHSIGGAITSFAISSIPPGMSFDTATGSLTGTPSTVASATSYTVTATNGTGSAVQVFTLTVTPAKAVVFSISSSFESRRVNTLANGFTVISTGGLIDNYTISPGVPSGMT